MHHREIVSLHISFHGFQQFGPRRCGAQQLFLSQDPLEHRIQARHGTMPMARSCIGHKGSTQLILHHLKRKKRRIFWQLWSIPETDLNQTLFASLLPQLICSSSKVFCGSKPGRCPHAWAATGLSARRPYLRSL